MIRFRLGLSCGRNPECSSETYSELSHAMRWIECPEFEKKSFFSSFEIGFGPKDLTLKIVSAMLLKLFPLIVTDRSLCGNEPNISFRRSVDCGVFGSVRPIFAIASNETSCWVRAVAGDSIQISRRLSESSNSSGMLNVGMLKHGETFKDRRELRGFKAAN